MNHEIREYWLQHAPKSYRKLGIEFEHCPRELTLPRSTVAHIYAARSGHGDFATYHERFHHANATTSCSCGAAKSPEQIFYCTKPEIKLPKVPRNAGNVAQYLIVTFNGAARLSRWMKETNFFTEICHRKSAINHTRVSQWTAPECTAG